MRILKTLLPAAALLLAGIAVAGDESKLTITSGQIVSADAAANTLVVKVEDGSGQTKDVTVAVGTDTKIIKDGKRIALADLKSGDKVSLTYQMRDGKNMAVSIGSEPKA